MRGCFAAGCVCFLALGSQNFLTRSTLPVSSVTVSTLLPSSTVVVVIICGLTSSACFASAFSSGCSGCRFASDCAETAALCFSSGCADCFSRASPLGCSAEGCFACTAGCAGACVSFAVSAESAAFKAAFFTKSECSLFSLLAISSMRCLIFDACSCKPFTQFAASLF